MGGDEQREHYPRLYPRCSIADTNTLARQMLHIREECLEVMMALHDVLTADAEPSQDLIDHLIEELHDLAHSAQTGIDVGVRCYPKSNPEKIRVAVV